MDEQHRRREILHDLLGRGPIESQEKLAELLGRHGIKATQATISRDLREIGAVKGPDGYVLPVLNPTGNELGLERALRGFVKNVDRGATLVVIRTGPGHAQLVALELDRSPPQGIIGTIAGDDTIFIATRSERAAVQLVHRLRSLGGLA